VVGISDGTVGVAVPDGAFTAQGIFGQFLYVNPAENITAVIGSAWRSPWDDRAEIETYAMIGAAASILHERT